MTLAAATRTRGASALALALALGVAAVVVTRAGWLCDDAYISFRTVDNLLQGRGAVWNAGERVQAYTHPLWLLLVTLAHAVTGEIFLTAIAAGAACSLAALAILAAGCARTAGAGVLAVLALLCSRAFVDYSTSGLENPLAHLLLALFVLLLGTGLPPARRLFALSLTASFGVLTRPDLGLLFLPALVLAARAVPWRRAVGPAAAGLAPLAAWELFSVVYYGFPFPNTAYAKLGSGLEASALWAQGARYLQDSLTRDPITLATITLGAAVALPRGDRWARALAAGTLLYLVYVVSIGGDFMSGRFLSAPLFLSAALLARQPVAGRWPAPVLAGSLIMLGVSTPGVPALTGASFGEDRAGIVDAHGVSDERRFYYPWAGLLRYRADRPFPSHPFAEEGRALGARAEPSVVVRQSVGYRGYFAGPRVRIIDELGLTDPLLARLPAVWSPAWRIGHFRRLVPPGYAQSADGGEIRLGDPDLARYHAELALITRGPLFRRRRWEAIVRMNLGALDHLVDRERYRFPGVARITQAQASASRPAIVPAAATDGTGLPTTGVRIDLERAHRGREVQLTLTSGGEHLAVFFRGGKVAAFSRFQAGAAGAAAATTIAVPAAAARGFDSFAVLPRAVPSAFAVGALVLR